MTTMHRVTLKDPLMAMPRSSVRVRSLILYAIPLGIALGLLALIDPMIAGAAYVLSFLILAITSPAAALLITFASASIVTDLPSGMPVKLSFGELNLFLLFPVCLLKAAFERRALAMGALAIPVFLYIAMCVVSTALNFDPGTRGEAISAILQMWLYLVVAVVVFSSTIRNPMDLYPCLNMAVLFGVGLAVVSFRPPEFLQMHKNAWGAVLSSLTVIAAELWFAAPNRRRKRLLLMALLILGAGLFFSLSRGAWLGAMAGVFVLILMRRQFRLATHLALVIVPLLVVFWFVLPEAQREYATGMSSDRRNIQARLQVMQECLDRYGESPIYGKGVSVRKELDATNLLLVTLAETGPIGVVLFLLIHLMFARMVWRMQKQVPLWHPLYSLLAVAVALVTRSFVHGMVDHYWSRGPILQAWGAAGMAICAANYIRKAQAAQHRRAVGFPAQPAQNARVSPVTPTQARRS